MYGHLLDGDLASNHLSWQWVAGTASSKPYLFNADNVARFAPSDWHSPGTVIDQSYEALDRLARSLKGVHLGRGHQAQGLDEPPLSSQPDAAWGFAAPSAAAVQGQDVWLVHPWNLSDPPPSLSAGTVSVGLLLTDFHQNWPWSEARWRFVCSRMADICDLLWIADAHHIATALQAARQVTSVSDPHLQPWLAHWAQCQPAPAIFPQVKQPCASFSTWWNRVSRHRQ
jgi:deoxyribodipyrimidine photo-lyase